MLAVPSHSPVLHDMDTESLRACFIIFPGTGLSLDQLVLPQILLSVFFFLKVNIFLQSSGTSPGCYDLPEMREHSLTATLAVTPSTLMCICSGPIDLCVCSLSLRSPVRASCSSTGSASFFLSVKLG